MYQSDKRWGDGGFVKVVCDSVLGAFLKRLARLTPPSPTSVEKKETCIDGSFLIGSVVHVHHQRLSQELANEVRAMCWQDGNPC